MFALLMLSTLWGSTFFWTKILLVDFHPISIVFFRCLFGVLFLLPFLIKQKAFSKIKLSPSLIIISLLGATVPWTLMTMSVQYLETTLTGIINSLTPIFGMLLSIIVLKHRPRSFDWLSLFLGFVGVVIIFIVQNKSIPSSEILGVLILLVATFSYSFTSILSSKYQKSTSPYILAFTTLFTATIVCGIIMVFVQPDGYSYLYEPTNFSVYLILGMLSSGLGYVVFYYLVSYGGPVYALFITYIMPIVTIMLGYFFLDESVTGSMIIGLLFILISITLMNYQKRREKDKFESA
ncbi:DMT family transporter [Alkalihalobacillus sp. BA299]|uniref:DMT family transporter n=1 Tax=Alkalihalobacillus sp. BA299 TaxID=2815938 RepID=UPI0027DCD159|nr:DMT family transporter [Alkalihalobacillus sp. BA299]